ncbi:hypothetical protein PoB_001040900 [Plakobranchus ocellatus]|uniref:ISXO2-like transposase domain-containing protein n=1 Tax=Plakobranchus ocellatus TaxID=259542 RepID=A0AAV3YPE0_9GAST|nr:hypothetical protein PoB_001040900 [Plakobranchus ocellatus]
MWDHKTILDCFQFSSKTSVDWRSFCCEVLDAWFTIQPAIGGPGIEVEIDETLIARRKYERGRILKQIWLFGGIERASKKQFVVALTGKVSEQRDRATLMPLIEKYIIKGSIIYSDSWGAYSKLKELNYNHNQINHSQNFVDPDNAAVHTQNIERLWRDIKDHVKRPGICSSYLYQYLARYLFISDPTITSKNRVHYFLKEAARLYPPQGGRVRADPEAEVTSSGDELELV